MAESDAPFVIKNWFHLVAQDIQVQFNRMPLILNSVMSMRRVVSFEVLTSDEGEAHGQLWRDLGDDVGGEVAGGEGGLAHQVEDGVGHLDQLARGEV